MAGFLLVAGPSASSISARAADLPGELLRRIGPPRPPVEGAAWTRVDFGGSYGPDLVAAGDTLLVGYLTEPAPIASTVPGADGALMAALESTPGARDLAGKINGSFALIQARDGDITLVADRFGSRMIFAGRIGDSWGVASHPSLLWHAGGEKLAVDPAALGGLLVRATPLQDRLIFAGARRLRAGRVLELRADGTMDDEAWYVPRWDLRAGRSMDAWADDLAGLLQDSEQRLRPLMKRPVLFLSGGMDSRLALAILKDHPGLRAVTLGGRMNLESRTAKAAAKASGVPWTLGGSDERWSLDSLRDAPAGLGALYSPLECHFAGWLEAEVARSDGPDAALLGDFLEAFAKLLGAKQSAELPDPATPAQVVDHIATLDKPVPPDMVERMMALLRPGVRERVFDAWRAEIEAEVAESQALAPDQPLAIDLFLRWREAPSVLTFGMLQDVRTQVPERSLSMCTHLHDLMLAMPTAVRDAGKLHPMVLRRVAPLLAALPDANTGMPAGAPRKLHSIAGSARRQIGQLRRKAAVARGASNIKTSGAWGALAVRAAKDPAWIEIIEDSILDPAALPPDLFDPEAVRSMWSSYRGGDAQAWRVVVHLLTFARVHRAFGAGTLA